MSRQHLTSEMAAAVHVWYDGRCANCQTTEALQVHHIVPLAAGGSEVLTNLVLLCEHCHGLVHGATTSSTLTRRALQHKKRHRQAYSPTPYGFDRLGDVLVPNAAEQRVIAGIQDRHAAGWSLRRIADELNRTATPTKTGARWYASTVRAVLANDLHVRAA